MPGRRRYVFSANGASSFLAWGNAPGFLINQNPVPQARDDSNRVMGWRTHQLNRAFSAYEFFDDSNLGRCPRLQMNRAFGAKQEPAQRAVPTNVGSTPFHFLFLHQVAGFRWHPVGVATFPFY